MSSDLLDDLPRFFGHTAFRPGQEALVRAVLAGRDVIAFTATATPEVRDDIVSLLGLKDPEVFVAGFDRPNIFFDVRRVSGELEKRALLPELVGSGRALVYAATRKSAERASDTLRAAG